MSKEELSSRLRDLGNGMYGLANDAAYIIQELEEVKAERDSFEAIGNRALAKVEEIEAERDELKEARRMLVGAAQADKAMIDRLRAERDELKDRLVAVTVNKRCENKWKTLCDWLRLDPEAPVSDVYDPATKPPRIITADELREGQTVAIQVEGRWRVRRITHVKASSVVCAEGYAFARDIPETFVLLADAPTQEPEQKRLTVADLEDAPVGSVLSAKGALRERVKKSSGLWAVVGEVELALPSRSLTTEGRTLTPPEPARRGRVVRASELRRGDRIHVWNDEGCHKYTVVSTEDWQSLTGESEIRLISRKPPTVADSPITVHALHGEPIDTRNAAVVYKSGTQTEVSIAYQSGAVEDTIEGDDAVTDWTPLVPAGQEG